MLDRNKRTKWIPALLAGILLILPGCVQEELTPPTPDSSATLRLSTKGITVNPDDTNADLEEYVKTLRLIGFQEGQQVVNHQITDWTGYTVQGEDPNTYIEIPLDESIGATIKRGVLDLYAVANEPENYVDNLTIDASTTQSEVESLRVLGEASNIVPSKENPFLMSAHVNTTLLQEENTIDVDLIRTAGKVELTSVKKDEEDTNLSGYSYTLSASGNVYQTYPLFAGTGAEVQKLDDNITVTDSPLYLSESTANAVTIEVSVTPQGETTPYKGSLAVQIKRNTCIQLQATISETANCLLLTPVVIPWEAVVLPPTYE